MAIQTIYVEILTPEKNLYSGFAREVYFPTEGGYIGVLPGHAPLVTRLGIGIITCVEEHGKEIRFFCSGGFAEVMGQDLNILANVAENPDEIDMERAKKALERAQQRIRSGSVDIDYHRAIASLQRSIERMGLISGNMW